MEETLDPSTRASRLFAELKELAEDARMAALELATDGEPELRAEVAALLSLVEGHDSDTPRADAAPAQRAATASQHLAAGTVLAHRYRILRPIGRGGLSVVYLAEQTFPVRREVALKLLAPGLEAAGLARFEGERDALARMSHPFIAQIHDAGFTEVGQAFVAMEHIDGLPLDVFCRDHDCDLRARLELFVKVCRGVAHAHQKGIVHRDIKPTNVLVTRQDGEATPKVIDFGIAKSTNPSLAPADNATRLGLAVGTPGYMSPEQAVADGRLVDTTADVYALGVVLYELLTGSLPHVPPPASRIDTQTWAQRLMSARLEPMSERLTSLLEGGHPGGQSRIPKRIAPHELRGDLEVIVKKALAPAPEDRYRTVSELAADIERSLRGEPILARPPSFRYVASRLLRRHRRSVLIASLALVLVVGTAFVFGALVSARTAAMEDARLARERATLEHQLARERSEAARKARARGAIAAAQAAIEAGNAAAAARNLMNVPADLRSWEWRWLDHAANQSELAIEAHHGSVRELVLSDDEAVIASFGDDGDIALWDPETGALVDRLETESPAPSSRHGLVFSAELGIAVTSDDATLTCAWDLVSRRARWCRHGRWGLQAESLLPSGELLLADGMVLEVVDAWSGETTWRFSPPSGAARAVWGAPELGRVIVLHGGGRVGAYAIEDDEPRLLWWRPGSLDALDRDRRVVIAVRGPAFEVRELFAVPTGEHIATIRGEPPSMPATAMGPDGHIFASVRGSLAVIRRSHDAAPSEPLLGHRAPLRIARAGAAAFWVGDAGGAIHRWPAEPVPLPATFTRSNDTTFSGAVSEHSNLAFTVGWGIVKAWDIGTGAEVWSTWLDRDYRLAVATRKDLLVVGSVEGRLTRLTLHDGEPTPLADLERRVTRLALLDDGLIVGTLEGEVLHTDLTGHARRWTAKTHQSAITAIALAPDQSRMALAADRSARVQRHGRPYPDARDGQVIIVDTGTGAQRTRLTHPGADSWLSLAWSPDGALLAAGGYMGELVVWDTHSWSKLHVLPSMGLEVRAIAFSRDSTRIFSADENGTVQVWTREGEHALTLPTRPGLISGLWLAPDDETLVAVNNLYPLVVYDPRPTSPETLQLRRAWSRHAALRARVDGIIEGASSVAEVRRVIATAPELETVRAEALALVRARGVNPNLVNSDVWGVVRYPGEPAATVALARARAEAIAEGWPIWEFENTRAFARLRDNDLIGAAESARTSIALASDRGISETPSEHAILALEAHRRGEPTEASRLLERARSELEHPMWRSDAEAHSLVEEVGALLQAR